MSKFKFGDKVLHRKFGFGVITSNRPHDVEYSHIDVAFKEYKGTEYSAYVEIPSLTPASESDWIKCSEHLPDCDEFRANPYRALFWIYCQSNDRGYILKAYRKYQNGQWAWVSQLRPKGQLTFPDELVTHYTPIEPPQPPQESQIQ